MGKSKELAMSQDSQSPGEIFRVQVPVAVPILLIAAVALFTLLYALWENARPTIRFLGASAGVAAGLLSAFYVGRALEVTIEQRDRALKGERVSRAFSFLERWNDPNFASLRSDWRKLLEEMKEKNSEEVIGILHSHEKRTVAVDVLNFFEEAAYAARTGAADIETMKGMFRTVVERYFSTPQSWVDRHRKEKHQTTLYEHLEWLRDQWKKG